MPTATRARPPAASWWPLLRSAPDHPGACGWPCAMGFWAWGPPGGSLSRGRQELAGCGQPVRVPAFRGSRRSRRCCSAVWRTKAWEKSAGWAMSSSLPLHRRDTRPVGRRSGARSAADAGTSEATGDKLCTARAVPQTVRRLQCVHDHRDAFEVKRLCEVLELNRSSYYKWLSGRQARAVRQRRDRVLAERIREVHGESGGAYGSPRGPPNSARWACGSTRSASPG